MAAKTSPKTRGASKAGDKVGSNLKDAVTSKVDEAGGAGGLAKEAASGLLPGRRRQRQRRGKGGMPGVGKGRRMPVQQAVDVAVPLETAYNQWTQFEDWPEFMHRVTRVTQEDDCKVSFATKIWGKTKEFKAEIETQRPDERIKWKVSQGITHTGVVTFHELAPSLTRIEINIDVEPGGLIEKAARGMRHIKRAVRADLHRFKAFIEMQELETGAWRGVIEDGELVEEHDESYDEERDYSEVDDLYRAGPTTTQDDEDSRTGRGDEDEDEDQEQASSPTAGRSQERRSARASGSQRAVEVGLVAVEVGLLEPGSSKSGSSRALEQRQEHRERVAAVEGRATARARPAGPSKSSGAELVRPVALERRPSSSGASKAQGLEPELTRNVRSRSRAPSPSASPATSPSACRPPSRRSSRRPRRR